MRYIPRYLLGILIAVLGFGANAQDAGTSGVSAWLQGPDLAAKTSSPAAATYNGYLYVLGGTTDAGGSGGYAASSGVQFAQIGEGGALSNWTPTTAMPAPSTALQAVAYNGYLYAAGGFNQPGDGKTVYYAPINSDGTIGTWSSASSLNSSRSSFGLAAHGGYIYASGGVGQRNFHGLNTTEYAAIKADGSLGAWVVSGSYFPYGLQSLGFAAKGGYLYAAGGFTCKGSYICGITGQGAEILSSVMVAKIGADGSPGAWQTTSPMQKARQEFGLLALNSQLYAIGGYNSDAGAVTVLSAVEVADIQPHGVVSGWRYVPPMPEGRMDFGAAASGHQLFAIAGGQLTGQYKSVLYADTQNFTCEQAIASGKVSQCYYGPDGTQYGLTANTDTWGNQKTLAESLGGSLVTVRSADENGAILANLATQQNVWIGYYYNTNDNEWAWQDGSAATYTNWGPGEPNNRTSEHCAEMFGNNRSSSGMWNNLPCSPSGLRAIIQWR